MSPGVIILLVSAGVCALTLTMTLINLRLYLPFPVGQGRGKGAAFGANGDGSAWPVSSLPHLTVCIPARNEEANIESCVRSLLASDDPNFSILVYDDASTDSTPAILARLAQEDHRVRLASTQPLPNGWNGKQHACWQMGTQALADQSRPAAWLLFTDADVRFEPGAIASARRAATELNADLVSTFPRQITGTLAEKAIVPMIFFILFSYLPFPRMRSTHDPAASAACGQFILVSRAAYEKFDGHRACQASMHDGVMLPRAARKAGFKTDLFDGTALCSVRMYRGLLQTWRGFAKNAFEGLGSVGLLVFITIMHLVGHAWPFLAAPLAALELAPKAWLGPSLAACALALAQRTALSLRFQQGLAPILLHPIAILAMTAIQWHSFLLHLTGKRTWRGRSA